MYTRDGTLLQGQGVEPYLPLVRRLAHHMVARLPSSVQVDDLIQAGMLGLLDALGRFEEGQGAQFETYATQRIRGAMLDELRRNDWMPRGVRQAQRKIDTVMRQLEHTLGRSPSEGEMARAMKLSLEAYQNLLLEAHGAQLYSYDDFSGSDDQDHYLERHIDENQPDPEIALGDQRFQSALVEGIEKLPEREKLVMGLYYEQDLNFKEIAAVLGVTESRICQLHSQAVGRLRARLKDWRK